MHGRTFNSSDEVVPLQPADFLSVSSCGGWRWVRLICSRFDPPYDRRGIGVNVESWLACDERCPGNVVAGVVRNLVTERTLNDMQDGMIGGFVLVRIGRMRRN